ncbi:probable inactive histone-lysine N-methyltransferase SUVR2 isoform X2 [Actinidia eriantha]|uniref:probable inactive histone-lysine N-methyltransferase SUVR2 isoform X2 n=1 Tax=Actinidia eriantha TaxID=165200 RepID=UPI00258DB5FC|nr:probable inactive histone-lysine N-methyltransferase SUVR2 isoform X2 [Actinidia eriantha]
MAPNARVVRAFRAMKVLGIPEEKVKPVLKDLLKLYEKNWELIEEENYRALADAIFDQEETQAAEQKKKRENTDAAEQKKKRENTDQREMDEEAQVHEEPERPLKRLRLRNQEGHGSPSVGNSHSRMGVTSLRQPKTEESELPYTCPEQWSLNMAGSSQFNAENIRVGSRPLSPQSLVRNKGKQPVVPKPSSVKERFESSQLGAAGTTDSFATSRTEPVSISPPLRLREKGKEPLPPQLAPRDKKTISGRSPHAVHLEEHNVKRGVVLFPKQVHNSHTLIKPKDEPFSEDIPQFEVPIDVIHPDLLSKETSSTVNGLIREPDGLEPLASQLVPVEDRNEGNPASTSERRLLENTVDESSSYSEIASAPSGEVKISLICNSALGRPDFHMPSIDAVVKMVEDKCLRSYKVLDPNFSVMNLMKDMCECFLELGTDSANKSLESIDVMPAVDLLNQSNALKCSGDRSKSFGSSNGVDDFTSAIKTIEKVYEIDKEKEQNGLEHGSFQSLVLVQQRQPMLDEIRIFHDVKDIAKGEERVGVSLANEVNDDRLPSFHYIPQNVAFQNAQVNFSLARIGEKCCSTCFGDCLSSPTPCACTHDTGGDFSYTLEGLLKEEFLEECILVSRNPPKHCMFRCQECPVERLKNDDIIQPCKGHIRRKFIKECWWKCGCGKQCGNRVVQRGLNCNLQVFMTPEGKGWGLRALQDLPKGVFVCEYVGEILTNAELYEWMSQSPNNKERAHLVLLDADWSSGVLKDEEALYLDATYFGNVARFINHRCFDPNLVEIPVEVETPDHHYYHIAFFTTRKVEALEELTWDYGIDFDDHDHSVKAFKCLCGSKFCRNIKRSSRSRFICHRI